MPLPEPKVLLPESTEMFPSEKVNPSNERAPSTFILLSTCILEAVMFKEPVPSPNPWP